MSTAAPEARPRKARAAGPADKSVDHQRAAERFRQLGDATRLRVLLTLDEGPRNVGDLCKLLGASQPGLSHHLALLRHGGLATPRRQGKENHYELTDAGRVLVGAARMLI